MKSIIMAGGSGTRLWPLSRGKYPKQFVKLKDFKLSLFQMTVERCMAFCNISDIYVLTVGDYEFIVRLQVEELGLSAEHIHVIVEPQMKNTLPAIYNAVNEIVKSSGKTGGSTDEVVIVMTSDHLMRHPEGLIKQIRDKDEDVKQNIYTFGVKPNAPETGFGYIAPGEKLTFGYKIKEFKEKPDVETAKHYLEQSYLWNSGMFMFGTDLFIQEVKTHAMGVYDAFQLPTVEERFNASPSISIDYGVMEKSKHTAVIPLDSDWDDLGSFYTFYDTFAERRDKQGNIGFGDEVFIDSSDNLIYPKEEKAYALIGVKDLVVVDQGDALLVRDKNRTQDVKRIVTDLQTKKDGRSDYHLTEYKPWGSSTVLENGQFYKIRRLTVLPGKRLNYEMHYHRSEHWVVVKGTANIVVDGAEKMILTNESMFIPAGCRHLLRNDGRLILEVIEVLSGQYLLEDDVVVSEL